MPAYCIAQASQKRFLKGASQLKAAASISSFSGAAPGLRQLTRLLSLTFASKDASRSSGSCHLLLSHAAGLWLCLGPLGVNVLDCCLDGILCQHTAVQLHGRQAEMLGNLAVLDRQDVINRPALDPAASARSVSRPRIPRKGSLAAPTTDVAAMVIRHAATGAMKASGWRRCCAVEKVLVVAAPFCGDTA